MREKRKESRKAKRQQRFQSWMHHQNLKKLKENPSKEGVGTCSPIVNRKDSLTERPLQGTKDSEKKGLHKEKRQAKVSKKKRPHTKFEEYLEMEESVKNPSAEEDLALEGKLAKKLKVKDGKVKGPEDGINDMLDGIPSCMDLLQKPGHDKDSKSRDELSKEDILDDCLANHSKRNKSSKNRKLNKASKSQSKMNEGKSTEESLKDQLKQPRTKFEEYLLMEEQKVASTEEDLATEKRLVTKLKVKDGKLGGSEDGLNDLLDGIPLQFDLSEDNAKEERSQETVASKGTTLKEEKTSEMSRNEFQRDQSREEDPSNSEKSNSNSEDFNSNEKPQVEITGMPEETQVLYHGKAAITKKLSTHTQGKSKKVSTDSDITSSKIGALKYVPPHLRSNPGNCSSDNIELRRKIKGLLNRLSESNIESIAGEVSTVFHLHGRSLAAQVVIEEVLASCSKGPRGNEQYAAVFAAFVSGIAASVGMDFGAKLLASLAHLFEEEYRKGDSLALRNLVLLLSYLYIFRLCSSDTIYDLLALLSKRLEEMDVATILNILQCCGMVLRGDDPTAMKDFVVGVQEQVQKVKALHKETQDTEPKLCGKRMEFMLETICDIKNNKKRLKDEHASHNRIKKWLQKLRIEDVQLRGLKWDRLLDPNKKGQWWLSGEIDTTGKDDTAEIADVIDAEVVEAQKMLNLAAKQRMNTEARRAVFCIIMSAEDYLDAFEKILRLTLPGKQDREILRVLVDCCLQEKVFNKYYSLLASKLCEHDKNHKYTLQYCVWDHFKQLNTMELRRLSNLARFLADVIGSFSLSLTVLKAVDFTDPAAFTPKVIMHFRILFETLLSQNSENVIWNIFTRIAGPPELEHLRNGLELFIHQHLTKNETTRKRTDSSGDIAILNKIRVAKKALTNVAGILL